MNTEKFDYEIARNNEKILALKEKNKNLENKKQEVIESEILRLFRAGNHSIADVLQLNALKSAGIWGEDLQVLIQEENKKNKEILKGREKESSEHEEIL